MNQQCVSGIKSECGFCAFTHTHTKDETKVDHESDKAYFCFATFKSLWTNKFQNYIYIKKTTKWKWSGKKSSSSREI